MLDMQPFVYHTPTKISFGEDTASGVADVIKELGGKKTLIITDANLTKAGVLEPVLASFQEDHFGELTVFDQVPPDSDVACVDAAGALARDSGCDSIVAVGGGSVTDTAKAVNICLTNGGQIRDYQGINSLPCRLKPLVAIPTTAGTGSEVSLVAMVKDPEEGKKMLFGSSFLAPDVAILDPKLLVSLPPRLTAATGLDALTHDLEAYVSLTCSPVADAIALESMRLLFAHLKRATECGDDLDARSATLIASTMSGLAFTCSGVGIVHALAHSVGARFGTHHGMTNAVFLPHGMEFNLETAEARYASIARFLGLAAYTMSDEEAARQLIESLKSFIQELGLATRLRDLGVPETSESEIGEIALVASTDPAIMFNPRVASVEDIVAIYKRAY